ncbi:MAG: glutamine--fructose-6-phosphate transaminase (isomerizing) [Desulfurococcales archaeon]|nr:glutamine--fructose-6-phosphate transaminase (isomerizing) [Desulfurococcales archaeon]
MCGIIGVVASAEFRRSCRLGTLIKQALKHLEYRGYDSVGFAIITYDGRLVVRKSRGMIDAVSVKLGFDELDGYIGIGHTRWATHGPPSDSNAHPHIDCRGRVAVVHNGIIENYMELKNYLMKRGHSFSSETDSEVIPHLIEEFKKLGASPYDAFKAAVSVLKGAYALAAIDLDSPDRIFFARSTSPLVVGIGSSENYVASDIPAFLEYTRNVVVLRDGEVGYITSDEVHVEKLICGRIGHSEVPSELQVILDTLEATAVDLRNRVREIDWTPEMAMRGGYPHFMLKEIHEQPQAASSTLAGAASEVRQVAEHLKGVERVIVVGAGTSYHASYIGALLLSNVAGVWSIPIISSEMRWYLRSLGEGDAVIAVSQSGETIDTLLAVREAKKLGVLTVSLSNVVDSAIPRESDLVIYTRAGPEIGVAATKTFTTQVVALAYLAAELARVKGFISSGEYTKYVAELRRLPEIIAGVIAQYEAKARRIAKNMVNKKSAFYLGRGYGLPISMEGALKLKEIAYIHAEAYPAGESKHGPIALVEEDFPVIFTALSDEEYELIKSNIEEMRARYAWVIAVVPKINNIVEEVLKLASECIPLPPLNPAVAPAAYIIPHQLIAYYTAVFKGHDPDKPRNLAKTVTVY